MSGGTWPHKLLVVSLSNSLCNGSPATFATVAAAEGIAYIMEIHIASIYYVLDRS